MNNNKFIQKYAEPFQTINSTGHFNLIFNGSFYISLYIFCRFFFISFYRYESPESATFPESKPIFHNLIKHISPIPYGEVFPMSPPGGGPKKIVFSAKMNGVYIFSFNFSLFCYLVGRNMEKEFLCTYVCDHQHFFFFFIFGTADAEVGLKLHVKYWPMNRIAMSAVGDFSLLFFFFFCLLAERKLRYNLWLWVYEIYEFVWGVFAKKYHAFCWCGGKLEIGSSSSTKFPLAMYGLFGQRQQCVLKYYSFFCCSIW